MFFFYSNPHSATLKGNIFKNWNFFRLDLRSPVSDKSPKHKPPPPKRTDSLLSEDITPPKEVLEAQAKTGLDYAGELSAEVTDAIMKKWSKIGEKISLLLLQPCYSLFQL